MLTIDLIDASYYYLIGEPVQDCQEVAEDPYTACFPALWVVQP